MGGSSQLKTVKFKMNKHLRFTFVNGDKFYVEINYYSLWGTIRPLLEEEDYMKYNRSQRSPNLSQGRSATKLWNFCKCAGYVDLQDDRIPDSVMFC